MMKALVWWLITWRFSPLDMAILAGAVTAWESGYPLMAFIGGALLIVGSTLVGLETSARKNDRPS